MEAAIRSCVTFRRSTVRKRRGGEWSTVPMAGLPSSAVYVTAWMTALLRLEAGRPLIATQAC